MPFQSTVYRQNTQGLVGEIANDGPLRAKTARLATTLAGTLNRIGRAFCYKDDGNDMGGDPSAGLGVDPTINMNVTVGGTTAFAGILGTPKRYALLGNAVDGPLGATYDLPNGVEADLFDMAIMHLSVSNGRDTAQAGGVPYGTPVFYCASVAAAVAGFVATTAADVGRLYVFPALADLTTVPATWKRVPGAVTTTSISTAIASATGNPGGNSPIDGGAVRMRVQITN